MTASLSATCCRGRTNQKGIEWEKNTPRRIDLKFAEENNLILSVLCLDFVLFAGLWNTHTGYEEKRRRRVEGQPEKKTRSVILGRNLRTNPGFEEEENRLIVFSLVLFCL